MKISVIKHRILHKMQNFMTETRGGLSVEAVLIFPMLTWAYVAMFVYWDAFHSQNTNLKAAYSISDALSRRNDVDQADINGLGQLFDYMTISNHPTWLRVTVVRWDEDNDDYELQWSHSTNGHATLTQSDVDLMDSVLPIMSDQEVGIIVETAMAYEPAFNVGLDALAFKNFIVTSPRFDANLCWDGAC